MTPPGEPDPAGEPAPSDRAGGPAPSVVVLDVGEVLIDGTRVWECWAEILGVSALTLGAVLGAAVVQGEDQEAVFPHVAPNLDWRAFVDEHERRYGGFVPADLYPDATPCLHELRDLGVTVGIAGNQPARRRQQLLGLDLPHDHLVLSAEIGISKPSPGFFEHLLDLTDVERPGRVLYVGDRVDHDVIPALEAGLAACWLRRGPWGQLQAVPDDNRPHLVLEGLAELPLLLEEWRTDHEAVAPRDPDQGAIPPGDREQ